MKDIPLQSGLALTPQISCGQGKPRLTLNSAFSNRIKEL